MTSLEVFQYNISFPWNSFYKRQFSLQLLADAIVSSNMKAAVKLQTSVANEDIYRLFSMKDNAWTLILFLATLMLWNQISLQSHWSQNNERLI